MKREKRKGCRKHQAWDLLRKLGAAGSLVPSKPPTKPNPIVARIVNLMSKYDTDKNFTSNDQRDYKELRSRTPKPSPLLTPFTEEEINMALESMKNRTAVRG